MELSEVRYEAADGVATITLHRPERGNAFTGTMADELVRAATAADDDEAVRVVLVTGAGRSFCVGAALSGGADPFSRRRAQNRPEGPMRQTIDGVPRDRGGVVS